MRIVFLGPPGAGKGTQAARMAGRFGVEHASTGEIFRRAAAEGSELGRTVKDYLDGGKLVPDELTSQVVERMVIETAAGYILDGYPRTLQQGHDLEQMLRRRGEQLDLVVYYELGEQEAERRLTGRIVCAECGANYHEQFMPPQAEGICDACGGPLHRRSDSSPEVVRKRLEEYRQKTEPLVRFYREQELLETVDASAAPSAVEQVTEDLLRRLQSG